MSAPHDPDWPPPEPGMSSDELQVDIDHTRKQLGQTVDALAEKFDLKSRARGGVRDAKTALVGLAHAVGAEGQRLKVRAEHAWHDNQGRLNVVGALIAATGIAAVVTIVVRNRRR